MKKGGDGFDVEDEYDRYRRLASLGGWPRIAPPPPTEKRIKEGKVRPSAE